jgi:hypothetical protein
VIEEHPRTGVRVRLLDGSLQTYARSELVRIEYADGSVSRRRTPQAAPSAVPPPGPTAMAPPPALAFAPPPPTPPPPFAAPPPLAPRYLTLGLGATFLGGDAARGVPMTSVLVSPQTHLASELGLRLSPAIAVGLYGDVGVSDPAAPVRAQCRVAPGFDCVGVTGRVGGFVRHTWSPLAPRSSWVSLGTGWEFGSVTVSGDSGRSSPDLVEYTGQEFLRIGTGLDFRSNPVLGVGLYGSFAFGEHSEQRHPVATAPLDQRVHFTTQVGVRLILFP